MLYLAVTIIPSLNYILTGSSMLILLSSCSSSQKLSRKGDRIAVRNMIVDSTGALQFLLHMNWYSQSMVIFSKYSIIPDVVSRLTPRYLNLKVKYLYKDMSSVLWSGLKEVYNLYFNLIISCTCRKFTPGFITINFSYWKVQLSQWLIASQWVTGCSIVQGF